MLGASADRYRAESGANIVEMALVLPVLLALLVGVADFGRAYYSYIIITNAAREGARYGSSRPEESAQWPLVREVVKLYTEDNRISLSDDDITISTETIGGSGSLRVEVSMDFPTIIGSFVGYPNLRLSNSAIMPILSYPG